MVCQDPDGCEAEAVVGVGHRVMWVCQTHYEEYLAMVERTVTNALAASAQIDG